MNSVIDKYSPNYDKIVNFLYEEDDIISKMLITYYQDYLFDLKNKNKKRMDFILDLYTSKDDFYNYVQEFYKVHENDLFDASDKVLNKVSRLYDKFSQEKLQKINNTRWL